MKVALIGYGKMGREIETVLLKRNHTVQVKIDINNSHDLNPDKFKDIDVAVEFSSPDSAFENITGCLKMGKPVVSGTTGWLERYDEAAELCIKMKTSFIHSSNFSLGVNILFKLNNDLAAAMEKYREYVPGIEEIHHTQKIDAPSGTAINIAEGIIAHNKRYKKWEKERASGDKSIPIRSVREGMVPGIHIVSWDSDIDSISLKHDAKSRKGLALGAVIAAEFIHKRTGVFTMNDVLGF